MHFCGCLACDSFLPSDRASCPSLGILVLLRSIVINLSLRIRNSEFYIKTVIFFFICLLASLLLSPCSMGNLRNFYFVDWRFFELCGNKFLRREFGLKFPLGSIFFAVFFSSSPTIFNVYSFLVKNPSIIENVEKCGILRALKNG